MYTSSAVTRVMATLALAAGFAAGAQAAALKVSPLAINLDDTARSGALSVTNNGDEACVIQIDLVRWTQKNGQNVQTPSADLLVNPPLATVEPGQSQTIRIGLKRATDSALERAYRLYITEVPPPGEHVNGLRIVLRMGVPIYVAPKVRASADVHWQAARARNGTVVLTLLNDGNSHVRIDSIKAVDAATGRVIGASRKEPFTLLAGQARRYGMRLPTGWRGGQLKLIAETKDGSSEAQVEVP